MPVLSVARGEMLLEYFVNQLEGVFPLQLQNAPQLISTVKTTTG